MEFIVICLICLVIFVVLFVIDVIIWKKKYGAADKKINVLESTLQERKDDIRRLSLSLQEYADKHGTACSERDVAKLGEKRAKEQVAACMKDIFIQKTELLERDEKIAKICAQRDEAIRERDRLSFRLSGCIKAEQDARMLLLQQQRVRCSSCGKYLVKDTSLHIQTANGVVCKSCFEKSKQKEE